MSREARAVVALLVLLVGGWLGYGMVFGAGEADVRILDVSGSVQRIRSGAPPADAAAGESVRARDRLVAGAGGRAVLAFGEEGRIVIEEASTLQVVAVTAQGVEVDLEGGRVRATVRAGGARLGVTAAGQSVTAEDADFTVARGADGTVAVEAERGEVRTTVPGAERLSAGKRVVVPRDRRALVSPAAESLLLNVAWPEATRTRLAVVDLEGTTEPGATVTFRHVEGSTVIVADNDGRFQVSVPLEEGENNVVADARSVLGAGVQLTWSVVRDTSPPPITVELHR